MSGTQVTTAAETRRTLLDDCADKGITIDAAFAVDLVANVHAILKRPPFTVILQLTQGAMRLRLASVLVPAMGHAGYRPLPSQPAAMHISSGPWIWISLDYFTLGFERVDTLCDELEARFGSSKVVASLRKAIR